MDSDLAICNFKKEIVMSDTAQPKGTQYLDLASAIANETCHYLESGKISKTRLQKLVGDKTNIRKIARANAHAMLLLVSDHTVEAKKNLEKFFLEVFNYKVNLSKFVFPEKEGLPVYGFNPRKWNEDQILEAIVKKWGIDIYKYLSPVAEKINRQTEQVRPKGAYVFCHSGEDEPDKKHRNKSYDIATVEGFPFANTVEYMLMQAYHKWSTTNFMDVKGWTRTSSLWSGGSLVCGDFDSAGTELRLINGDRGSANSGDGPRELFL